MSKGRYNETFAGEDAVLQLLSFVKVCGRTVVQLVECQNEDHEVPLSNHTIGGALCP